MVRLEVVLVNVTRQVAWNIQLVFDESAIDHQLSLIIRDLARTPSLDLPAQRIKVALDAIYADRQRVDDRKVLGMLR